MQSSARSEWHAGQRNACAHVGTNGIGDGRDHTVSPHVVFLQSHNSEVRACIYQHRLLLLSPGKDKARTSSVSSTGVGVDITHTRR